LRGGGGGGSVQGLLVAFRYGSFAQIIRSWTAAVVVAPHA